MQCQTWALFLFTPCLLSCHDFSPFPQVKDTPEAPGLAQANLKAMGPMSKGELITLATISGAVVLWMFGDAIGCPAVLAAMLALGTLLCTGESLCVCVWGGGGGIGFCAENWCKFKHWGGGGYIWMFGDAIGCPAVLVAMLALATLLCHVCILDM